MFLSLFGKKCADRAWAAACHWVPSKFLDAPPDLTDRRVIRHVSVDGKPLSFALGQDELWLDYETWKFPIAFLMMFLSAIAIAFGLPLVATIFSWISFRFIIQGVTSCSAFGLRKIHAANMRLKNGKNIYEEMGVVPLKLGFFASLAIFFGVLISSSYYFLPADKGGDILQGVLFAIVATCFCVGTVLIVREDKRRLATQLYYASRGMDGDTETKESEIFKSMENARLDQNAQAKKDKTTYFPIGVATEDASLSGDLFASNKGQIVGITKNDMSTHLMVFGDTGTGKTATVLLPIFRRWSSTNSGGALILDGKGALPIDFKGSSPDYVVLDPKDPNCFFNPIAAMKAEEVVDILLDVMVDKNAGGSNQFWTDSGSSYLKGCALCLELIRENTLDEYDLDQWPWNLEMIYNIAKNDKLRTDIAERCKILVEQFEVSPIYKFGFAEVSATVTLDGIPPSLDPKTLSNITKTAESWISPFINQRDIIRWSSSLNDGVKIETCLDGAKIGIYTPSSLFGRTGTAIQALAKARFYKAIKSRKSNWKEDPNQKSVMLMIDECHLVMDKQDEIFAIARSLGLIGVCATQHVDNFYEIMGRERAKATLGHFRNIVSLASSHETCRFLSERSGSAPLKIRKNVSGIDFNASIGNGAGSRGRNKEETASGMATFQFEERVTWREEEIKAMTTGQFRAVAILNRANTPRRASLKTQIGGVMK